MNTEDLLFLLASFGRPADNCPEPGTAPPSLDSPENTELVREYLACALRDRVNVAVAETCDACDAQIVAAVENATAAANAQSEIVLQQTIANLVVEHVAAIRALNDQHAAQLSAFHCGSVTLAHGTVSGETNLGGSGLTFTCNAGYSLSGAGSATCTQTGAWDATPVCELENPCTADEDDCAADATCAHTGPGQHSCECNNDADGVADFFGTGVACSQCSACPDGWSVHTPCTSTADTVCTDPCINVDCGPHGTCSGAGECTCTDAYTGANCEHGVPIYYVHSAPGGSDQHHAHALQGQFCAAQGDRLCTYQELCPANCGDQTYQDAGHSWVPYAGFDGDYSNIGNSWVFLGTDGGHPSCRDHNGNRNGNAEVCGIGNPGWSGDVYGSGVYCCG